MSRDGAVFLLSSTRVVPPYDALKFDRPMADYVGSGYPHGYFESGVKKVCATTDCSVSLYDSACDARSSTKHYDKLSCFECLRSSNTTCVSLGEGADMLCPTDESTDSKCVDMSGKVLLRPHHAEMTEETCVTVYESSKVGEFHMSKTSVTNGSDSTCVGAKFGLESG